MTTSNTVMTDLKDATSEQHTRAERHPMQAALVRGRLPLVSYAAYLVQLQHVHETLELGLTEAQSDEPRLGTVVRPTQYRVESIEADLDALGFNGIDRTPTDATSELCARIESVRRDKPLALLGFHYVLEGSTNGGRFIARALRGTYGLSEGGTSYLDPYGEAQIDEWSRFREDMASLELSETEHASIIDTASVMFDGITSIMDSLSGEAAKQPVASA